MGIEATPMSTVAPGWLVRFRKAGRFGRRAATRADTQVDTHSATHVV
jgi:NADH dehydrogenase